jgi:hypothetical protein
MAWQNPKTDWAVNPKNPVPEDFNRIEGNIDFLKSDIETKKGVIVAAINDMNQPAEVTDSHAQLADKIRDISNDATAVVGDVESGKTFYSAGAKKTGTLALSGTAGTGDVLSGKTFYNTALKTKRTGTMPNQGAAVITPGTSNKAIVAGYHNGQGYVKGDADLKANNIVEGKNIFGVVGSAKTEKIAYGSAPVNIIDGSYKKAVVTGLAFTPRFVLGILSDNEHLNMIRSSTFPQFGWDDFYAQKDYDVRFGPNKTSFTTKIIDNGFEMFFYIGSGTVNWVAIG